MAKVAATSKSDRLDRMQQGLLLVFVGVCVLMIVMTLILALSEEGEATSGPSQNPVYLAPTPTRAIGG